MTLHMPIERYNHYILHILQFLILYDFYQLGHLFLWKISFKVPRLHMQALQTVPNYKSELM